MFGQSHQPSEFVFPSAIQPPVFDDGPAERRDERWGWLEMFVLIQVFWAVLLFIPGSQAYRIYIRAFPYLSSLVALVACARTTSTDAAIPGARWVLAALFVLILNLIHEATWVTAGLAQIVFQIAISAPVFWGARIWITHDRLERVMILILAANFMGAGLGLLQVYYPETFLPPEFSSLATKLNPEFVSSLTYVGSGKRTIVRPPGLSDLPGGAAIAGTIAALLGFAFALRSDRAPRFRAAYAAAAVMAITVVYLTQVRSMFLMIVGCMCAMVVVRLRQGRILQGGWMAATAAVLVAGSFLWAVTVGGDIVADRYLQIVDFGVLETFRDNRGAFLDYTIRQLPFEYPFGAGLGRWGMMSAYFPESSSWQYPALYAEIQLTGWLFDGGLIMWLLYPAAMLLALRQSYRLAVEPNGPLNDLAMMVMAIQLLIAGLCFTGPVFNTQIGIIFWLATAILAGCHRTLSIQAWEESLEASADDPVERFPERLGA